jgi:hypothetical protein
MCQHLVDAMTFERGSGRYFLDVACVSRMLSQVVLDKMWWDPYDLVPLIKLLPPDCIGETIEETNDLISSTINYVSDSGSKLLPP